MKTLTWTQAGNEIELRAEYKSTLVNEIIDADGYKIETGKQIKTEDANLEFWLNGKKIDSCWNTAFWKVIDIPGTDYKRPWAFKILAMSAKRAELVDTFLKSVIADGEAEEVKEAEVAETIKIEAEKIEAAKKVIAQAEAQSTIPTDAEYRAWRKQYNDINNEGGEGYIPTRITKERYEMARAILNK